MNTSQKTGVQNKHDTQTRTQENKVNMTHSKDTEEKCQPNAQVQTRTDEQNQNKDHDTGGWKTKLT